MAHAAVQHLQQGPAVVHLNVGGILFQTSRETLMKAEAAGLRDMLINGNNGSLRFDCSGHLFLDSNPRTFEVVLDYLRDGTAALPGSQFELHKLWIDARKFQVHELEAQVLAVLQQQQEPAAAVVSQPYPTHDLQLASCLMGSLPSGVASATVVGSPGHIALNNQAAGISRASSGQTIAIPAQRPSPPATQSHLPLQLATAAGVTGQQPTQGLGASNGSFGTATPTPVPVVGGPECSMEAGSSATVAPPKRKRSYFEYAKKDWEEDEQFRLPVPLPDGSKHWPLVDAGDPDVEDRGHVVCRLCRLFDTPCQFTTAEGYTGGKKSGLMQHQLRNRDHQNNLQQLQQQHLAQLQQAPLLATPQQQRRPPLASNPTPAGPPAGAVKHGTPISPHRSLSHPLLECSMPGSHDDRSPAVYGSLTAAQAVAECTPNGMVDGKGAATNHATETLPASAAAFGGTARQLFSGEDPRVPLLPHCATSAETAVTAVTGTGNGVAAVEEALAAVAELRVAVAEATNGGQHKLSSMENEGVPWVDESLTPRTAMLCLEQLFGSCVEDRPPPEPTLNLNFVDSLLAHHHQEPVGSLHAAARASAVALARQAILAQHSEHAPASLPAPPQQPLQKQGVAVEVGARSAIAPVVLTLPSTLSSLHLGNHDSKDKASATAPLPQPFRQEQAMQLPQQQQQEAMSNRQALLLNTSKLPSPAGSLLCSFVGGASSLDANMLQQKVAPQASQPGNEELPLPCTDSSSLEAPCSSPMLLPSSLGSCQLAPLAAVSSDQLTGGISLSRQDSQKDDGDALDAVAQALPDVMLPSPEDVAECRAVGDSCGSGECGGDASCALSDTALLRLIQQSSIGASLPLLADLDELVALGADEMAMDG